NAVIDYYGIARDNREDRIRSQITYVYSRSREVTSILNSLLQSISGNRNMFSRAAEDGLGDAMERADQELEQYAQEMESIRLCRKYCNVAEAIRASKLELMKSADVRSAWVEAKDAFGVIVDDGFPDYWSESSLIDLSGQIPSLDVSCCLCAERDFQRFRKIQPNDARDIIALSVAFPNCDYLVVERFFGHIMIQNRYLRDRYNGKVFTSMKEFKDYVNAQSLLKV
ncbi:MAG: hypothetical protein KJ042_14730, partial [Deltaproteobacteria bacterium]|nr:hypothetical protein [Deltaproteobacteria bacterium]